MKFNPQDTESSNEPKPEGDYLLEVIGTEKGQSNGEKTRGTPQVDLKCRFVDEGGYVYETLIVPETGERLANERAQASIERRVNAFIVSTSFPVRPGHDVDASTISDHAKGGKGWARIIVDEYQGKKKNKVAFWYVNKEKHAHPAAVQTGTPSKFGF